MKTTNPYFGQQETEGPNLRPTICATGITQPSEATIVAAEDGKELGRRKAIVSAFDTKYKIGYHEWHTVKAGAFTNTIAAQASRVPLFFQHNWDWSEQVPIGFTEAAEETAEGLQIDAAFWLDLAPSAACWRALEVGALREWSIGYHVIALERDPDDENHFYITEAELLEASVVLRGANPATRTLPASAPPPDTDPGQTSEPEGNAAWSPEPDQLARLLARPGARAALRV